MMKYLDLRFDQLMGRYGFILGAIVLVIALAGLLLAWRSDKAPRALIALLTIALALGAVMFGPSAPRVAKAFWRLAFAPPPPSPSGPLRVGEAFVALAPKAQGEATSAPILARIWYPAAPDAKLEASGGAPIDCAALSRARLADPGPQGRFPLLLYAPGFANAGDDNSSTAAMASHGYVVLAINHLDWTPPPGQPQSFFDYSSEAAYQATLRRGAEHSIGEAKVALQALDILTDCAKGDFAKYVAFDRVGFFGFSFGGSVAANAAILDPRVVAAVNLDGWVFGPALEGGIAKPYMMLFDDEPLPDAKAFASPDPATRAYAKAQDDLVREHGRLFESPDKYGFWFRNAVHANFNDRAFGRDNWLSWFFADPSRVKAIREDYLLAFFDAYLRHRPQTLLNADPSPYIGVTPVKGRPRWAEGEERVPFLAWIGLR
ncbi:Platelet-activating factor acetylhydrolase plasma/intracellular isoform II [Methylocella silvestris BL2]|uniref:Platelet-activating factor acetylhydrolase plasma/intracellular isoform II n=1 Tax=Methylocella silvestris (strain DSM 15510 / CIP 108128 / LMG 27833 / NCIMB 13906 / BL2) TaxID=395965 RepID=B8EPK9_METSB|nr:hypothetical protein [Methylocella silvestris]ACK50214.1 Platelet-activating factor acetylhydrolase plasma/intracellular isoform II [Methylocella silvestris BL2]